MVKVVLFFLTCAPFHLYRTLNPMTEQKYKNIFSWTY
jgi:hypothetical protein